MLNLSELHLGERIVSGTGADTDAGVEVQVFRNTTSGNPEATGIPGPKGAFTILQTKPLDKDDLIRVRQKKGDKLCPFSDVGLVVSPIDLTPPNLIGIAPFGVVTSQQANSFSQADPFIGFTIGYMSTARRREICRRPKAGGEEECYAYIRVNREDTGKNNPARKIPNRPQRKNLNNPDDINLKEFFLAYEKSKETPDTTYEWTEALHYQPHWNIPIQGISSRMDEQRRLL